MKCLRFKGVLVVCLFIQQGLKAQSNDQTLAQEKTLTAKPALFHQLRAKNVCGMATLDRVFSARDNSIITINVSDELILTGQLLEKVQVSPELETVNIRCGNYKGALLTLSKIKQPDNSFKYVGRIINRQFNDVLILVQENGQYFFKKQPQSLTIADCPLSDEEETHQH